MRHERIPESNRRAILKNIQAGYHYRYIARIFGISIATISKIRHEKLPELKGRVRR